MTAQSTSSLPLAIPCSPSSHGLRFSMTPIHVLLLWLWLAEAFDSSGYKGKYPIGIILYFFLSYHVVIKGSYWIQTFRITFLTRKTLWGKLSDLKFYCFSIFTNDQYQFYWIYFTEDATLDACKWYIYFKVSFSLFSKDFALHFIRSDLLSGVYNHF